MGKDVQIQGFATATIDQMLGLIRELMIDTSRGEIRVMDGVIPGGHRIPNIDTINTLISAALNSSGITLKFFVDTAAMAASTPTASILAVVQTDGADSFYLWKNVANPNDGTSITGSLGGSWRKLGGDGHLNNPKEILPVITGGPTYTYELATITQSGWYQITLQGPTVIFSTAFIPAPPLTNSLVTTSVFTFEYRVNNANNMTIRARSNQFPGVEATIQKVAGVWQTKWSRMHVVENDDTMTSLSSGGGAVTVNGPGFYLFGAGATQAPVGAAAGRFLSARAPGGGNSGPEFATEIGDPNLYYRVDGGSWSFLPNFSSSFSAFGLGVYCFAKNAGGTIAPLTGTAGSNLTPADDAATTAGSALTGTWIARGAGTTVRATLWQRSA